MITARVFTIMTMRVTQQSDVDRPLSAPPRKKVPRLLPKQGVRAALPTKMGAHEGSAPPLIYRHSI